MKPGTKKGRVNNSKYAKLSPDEQLNAADYGEIAAKDLEAFELAEAWMTIGNDQSALGKSYREVIKILKPEASKRILKGFARELEDETGRWIADICRTGCTWRLRNLADAIDALLNPSTDPVEYILIASALVMDKDFRKKAQPRELPFTYDKFKIHLDKQGIEADKSTCYRAAENLRAYFKPDKRGPKPKFKERN